MAPPYVAPNELIASAWGNAVVDDLIRLDLRRARSFSAAGQAVSGAFGTAGGSVCSVTVPAQDFAGDLIVHGLLRLDRTVATDDFRVQLRAAGTTVLAEWPLVGGGTVQSAGLTGKTTIAAGAARTLNTWVLRQTGTGTASTFANGTVNRLDVEYLPS